MAVSIASITFDSTDPESLARDVARDPTAAAVTVAQVSSIVETGKLDPEVVVTPAIYVNRLVEVPS